MHRIWIQLLALHIIYSSAGNTPKTYYETLMYGQQLSIRLPVASEKLEFIPTDESLRTILWSRSSIPKRGTVTGRDDERRFIIYSVTFDDQGTYSVLNYWSKTTFLYLLKVITKRSTQNCVAGETLRISLEGLSKNEVTLHFSNQDNNLTVVERGSPVGNLHFDYMGRIQVTSNSIEVLNVNVSDVGNYTLSDRLNRKIKIIKMNLVDHHEGVNAAPFMGLLMLLGIPPCIFCCCRKKICKKSSQPSTTTTTLMFDNQINPPGHPPPYTNPAVPTQVYTPGYPAVGESTVHPPPNPTYPPQPPYSEYPATSPAMPPNPAFNPGYPPAPSFPQAPPPQWSGTHYNQSGPAPGFAPVMYSGPPGTEPVKGEITCTTPLPIPPQPGDYAPSPVGPESVKGEINPMTPLLTPPQPEVSQPPAQYVGGNVLNSSDSAVQFNLGKNSSSNFL